MASRAVQGKIEWTRPQPALSKSLAGVKLLKLHGSLNWYVRGSFEHLADVFEKKPSKVVISKPPRTKRDEWIRAPDDPADLRQVLRAQTLADSLDRGPRGLDRIGGLRGDRLLAGEIQTSI